MANESASGGGILSELLLAEPRSLGCMLLGRSFASNPRNVGSEIRIHYVLADVLYRYGVFFEVIEKIGSSMQVITQIYVKLMGVVISMLFAASLLKSGWYFHSHLH